MRRIGLLVGPAAIALGIAAEWVAFSWDQPRRWLPDLLVGLTYIGCGLVVWERSSRRGMAALLAAVGVAWFLGNFVSSALYLHRGPLVHLLLSYPGWRPRSRVDGVATGVAYAAAIATPVWRSEPATIVFALGLVAVAGRGFATAAGRTRYDRRVALQGATALALVLVAGAAARLAVPAGDAVLPSLLAYEVILAGVAVGLLAALRTPAASSVADLVVELGETTSGRLREALARALGDPMLELGYWSPERGAYVDETGATVALPDSEATRSATFVEREGEPFAVLVHDATVLRDAALVDAVASATRLSESNVALRAEVLEQVDELTASRRRLLVAADGERRRLDARLRGGPERRLVALAETLAEARARGVGPSSEHLERAESRLAKVREEILELAAGLHPRELAEAGLAGALASLAERAPVAVALDVGTGRLRPELEATAYFLCAEALANVAKYASASRVEVEVAERDGRLVVVIADDGVGGADVARGTGLQGLADRVEALGGSLDVTSPHGKGTRLAADIPLDDDAP